MTWTPIAFYLMIGFAHWTAHIIQCSSCRAFINASLRFALEGVTYCFGWPIQAVNYLLAYFAPREPLDIEAIDEIVKSKIKDIVGGRGGQIIELEQGPDESNEDFKKRIFDKIAETKEQLERGKDERKSSGRA